MKKILVIGAGLYQVPLLERISALGHEVYCVDYNPQAVGFSKATGYSQTDVLDKEACLKYAKEIGIDAVLTYGATLPLPTVSYIGKELGLPVLPVDTAEISKSKYLIKKKLAEHGCNISGDFFEMHSVADADVHRFTYPCVIKPSDGSGSKGVSVVKCESELDDAVRYAFESARYGCFYAEGFVKGEEYTVESFISEGQVFVYGVIKTTFEKKENGELEYGHRVPSGLLVNVEETIAEEVKKAIEALNITMGSVNFDVILSDEDGKPYIIDCGIRIGQNLIASHIVPLSRGVSVIDNTIALALGERVDAAPKFCKCIATRLLIYRPGVITEIKDMSELIGKNGIEDVVMRKTVGDVQREYKEKSDNCGWVIATGNTPDEAELNAENAKRILKDYIIIE